MCEEGRPGRGALERKNGCAEQELCADPVGTRARSSHAGLPAAPAAAGGRPNTLDEMAEPGRISTLMCLMDLSGLHSADVPVLTSSTFQNQNNEFSQFLQQRIF